MTWSKALVSTFEQHRRRLALNELLTLSTVFKVPPIRLLDPWAAGVVALDLDGPGEVDSLLAREWLSGRCHFELDWDEEKGGYRPESLAIVDEPGPTSKDEGDQR